MYATVEQVERLMAQFVIGPSSKPNSVQIEAIIDDISHEVNVLLTAKGIATPVSTPTGFTGYLGLLVSYGATAAILKSMFPSASGPAEAPAYAFWEARYNRGLKGLTDGSLIPSDVIQDSGTARASTYVTRNPSGEESLGVHEPWFGRSFYT